MGEINTNEYTVIRDFDVEVNAAKISVPLAKQCRKSGSESELSSLIMYLPPPWMLFRIDDEERAL